MKHTALLIQNVGTKAYMEHLEVVITSSNSLHHEEFEWCHLKGGRCILIYLTAEYLIITYEQ